MIEPLLCLRNVLIDDLVKLKTDDKGEVNLEDKFLNSLDAETKETEVDVTKLKATQNFLNGNKISKFIYLSLSRSAHPLPPYPTKVLQRHPQDQVDFGTLLQPSCTWT